MILISDTFTEFAAAADEEAGLADAVLQFPGGRAGRWRDHGITRCGCEQSKLTTVKALQSIGFETIASGDSYNDLGMIRASKAGFLFCSTDQIKAENPDIPAYETYGELLDAIKKAMKD